MYWRRVYIFNIQCESLGGLLDLKLSCLFLLLICGIHCCSHVYILMFKACFLICNGMKAEHEVVADSGFET